MKLKTRVPSLDDVPEQYRASYVPAEDGKSFTLEEFELEDTAGLKANHDRILKQHKATQEELKKVKDTYGDLDPVKAREAQKRLEELENKSLMDEGKFEELFAKRTEALNRDHENQKAILMKEVEKYKGRTSELETSLKRTTIEKDFHTEAVKRKIRPALLPFLELAAKQAWDLDEEGKPIWKENGLLKYSKDGSTPAGMADYLDAQIANAPDLVEGSSGNGSNGNTQRGTGVFSISRTDMRDVRKYEAAKAQAEKQGVPLQVTE